MPPSFRDEFRIGGAAGESTRRRQFHELGREIVDPEFAGPEGEEHQNFSGMRGAFRPSMQCAERGHYQRNRAFGAVSGLPIDAGKSA